MLLLEPWLAGAQFLEDVRAGHNVDWAHCHMSLDQADHVLAALGLVHVPVKLMINDIDDKYEAEVSGAGILLVYVGPD